MEGCRDMILTVRRVGSAVNITLNPLARKEINVATFFKNTDNIAYITLTSDSFYLSGYTKFFKRGNRVAISATTGNPRGIFLKKDHQGLDGNSFCKSRKQDSQCHNEGDQ